MTLIGKRQGGIHSLESPPKRVRQEESTDFPPPHNDTDTLKDAENKENNETFKNSSIFVDHSSSCASSSSFSSSSRGRSRNHSLSYSDSDSHRSGSGRISNNSRSCSRSSISSSVSSRSLSPVSPSDLSLPVHIVRSLRSGNNGQVFLAQSVPTEEREAAPRGTLRHPSFLSGGRFHCGAGESVLKNVSVDVETSMAVKCMHASSRHARREIRCLRYLNSSQREKKRMLKSDNNQDDYSVHFLESKCPPLSPFPELFFTQKVGKYVAIGLELLGPDLFDFTGKYFLEEDELCLVGIELLRTLCALHQSNIVHRSVKPENFCWNVKDIFKGSDITNGLPDEISKGGNSSLNPSIFMFKIIDYGRSTIIGDDVSLMPSHRPYTGWWHSLRGFLGQPLGQKDDLMGVAHTLGYLLDDYQRDGESGGSSLTSREAAGADGQSLDTQRNGRDYSAMRRRLSRRLASARPVAAKGLSNLLPDRNYPPEMPRWWVEWFAACSVWCLDDGIATADMAERMAEGLRRRVKEMGRSVKDARRGAIQCLQRYLRCYGKGEEKKPYSS